jgi:threonine 3-dehydrogenase
MQAVRKERPEPGFVVADVPQPEPGPGEVLLEVVAASVCGTDIHLYDWNHWAASRVKPPRVMGHELCGRVIAHGEGVTAPTIGTRVAMESHIVCHQCVQCRTGNSNVCANTRIIGVDVDGGFASHVAIPAENAHPIPDAVASDVAAAMEPFGNAIHACSYGEIRGAKVAILGCGPLGCAAIAVAKVQGAAEVIALDTRRYRLELAEKMGADAVIQVGDDPVDAAIARVAGGPVDCAIEMSGAPSSLNTALRVVRPAGWISILGIGDAPTSIDVSEEIVNKGLRVFGVMGRKLPETWEIARRYLDEGTIDVASLITHHMPLTDIDRAIQLMKSGECGKVSLTL